MIASRVIVVRQNNHVAPAQMLAILALPLTGAAGVRGRDKIERTERICVFLTFRYENRLRRIGGE